MRRTSLAVLRTQPDDRLVALARTGDEQAFEAIVVRYRRPLLRHAQRLLPEAGAEDALQHAFLSAWSALRRGDDVRELSSWLHRIVHNVALNALRGAQRGEHAELTDAVSAGVTTEDEIERRMAMRTRWPASRRCPSGSARRSCASPCKGARRRRSPARSGCRTAPWASSSCAAGARCARPRPRSPRRGSASGSRGSAAKRRPR